MKDINIRKTAFKRSWDSKYQSVVAKEAFINITGAYRGLTQDWLFFMVGIVQSYALIQKMDLYRWTIFIYIVVNDALHRCRDASMQNLFAGSGCKLDRLGTK